MQYGCDCLGDPVEQLLKAQQLQLNQHCRATSFVQTRRVNPDPQVAQQQRHRNKHEPQMGVLRTRVDARLMQLAKARFDAKPFAVALADRAS